MDIKIGIGKDRNGWYKKFESSIASYIRNDTTLSYNIIDLDSNNYQEEIKKFDVILWNPGYMGLRLSSHYKEKVYFAEKILGKLFFPCFDTIWHFESKVAQNLLFENQMTPTPKTYVTYDYQNALEIIKKIEYPIVLKRSDGASSENVRLIENCKSLVNYSQRVFCDHLWSGYRKNHSKFNLLINNFSKRWFWSFIISQFIKSDDGMGVLYLQEFIPNNYADLRITIIGNKYAFAFWRNNRPGDFRASGSGQIDYKREIPFNILRYCQNINQTLNFDTMAYDILFRGENFIINEMSYNYIDKAIFNAPGYYILGQEIEFINGNTWPQELWVRALIEKIKKI